MVGLPTMNIYSDHCIHLIRICTPSDASEESVSLLKLPSAFESGCLEDDQLSYAKPGTI